MIETDEGNTNEVQLSGLLVCESEEDAKIIKDFLPEHMRLSQEEEGCMSFDVSPTENPLVWRVQERFRDAEAFGFHQQRTRVSAWWAATAHIPRKFEVIGLG